MSWLRRDPVLLLLSLLGWAAAFGLDFLVLAPNRLLTGHALMLWDTPAVGPAAGVIAAWLALWLAALMPAPRRLRGWSTAVLASAVLVALPWLAGAAAARLLVGAPEASRVQLGAGFWSMLLLAGLLVLDRLRQLTLRGMASTVWLLALLGAVIAMGLSDRFSALALAREYAVQHGAFARALMQHLRLVGLAVTLALIIGVPLALLAHRRRPLGAKVLGVLNLLQTIPSLALFALLIGPLAWLAQHALWLKAWGIGGTGAAPAVIALCAYALLPVVRSVLAGLEDVPAATLDAARGMGLGAGQMLRQVQLPLAWPVLLAGLRIVVVQSIGLAAVAALIGAGGLGQFVFRGLGEGANDLVALGTLAIIALALIADALFHALENLTRLPT